MALLEIRKYPDPILRQKSQPVEKITKKIRKLIFDMIETMYKNQGVGLAAPQIGISKRIIVININSKPVVLVNPKIIKKLGSQIQEEGCLSFPEIFVPIKRAAKVTAYGLDINGKKITLEVGDLAARALQHEVEHLDGILIIDKIPFWQRRKLKKKLEKFKK